MICPACIRLRTGEEPGATCPECGTALVPTTESHAEALVQAALRSHLERWRADGLLDGATTARLQASLEGGQAPSPTVPSAKPVDTASSLETWADEVAESFRQAVTWRPGWGAALAHSLEEAAKAEREAQARQRAEGRRGDRDSGEDGLGAALDSGQALFGRGSLGGGLEAVVALDEVQESTPKLHEYIWWFLGAVLVLGGSLMGVREAWRALGGVPRQLLVTGALFGYHAAFIGLGAFLSRRSPTAGRILAVIGVALLPVVFVALSALVALSPWVGVPVALAVAGLGLLPLRMAGRLLHGATAASLALALFPSLLASLPLMGLEEAPWLRALCAFAGVAALGVSAWRASQAPPGKAPLASVGAALYGALALAVFCVSSAPLGFDALEAGGALFAGMTLWAVALAAVVASAAASPAVREAYPRAGPVLETLAHAVVASGALAGALGAFSAVPGDDTWVDWASVAAPALATGVFYLLEPQRRALMHPAVMAAMLTGLLLARTQAPGNPAWWLLGATAVAAGLLPLARWTPQEGPRLRLLTWGVVSSVAAMPAFILLYAGWGPFDSVWPRVLAGLLIAGAAHAAGGWRWRGLHYLGGVAVLFGAFAALEAFPDFNGGSSALAVLVLTGGLYGLAALPQRTDDLQPLDDLSLAMASLAVLASIGLVPALPPALESFSGRVWAASLPTVLASALLLLRVRRDGSRTVAFVAASGLALVASQVTGTVSDFGSAWAALVAACVALGFTAFAALRGPALGVAPEERPRGRRLLGAITLPFSARGLPLFMEGFAAAAFLPAFATVATLLQWRDVPVDAERSQALLAGGLLAAGALVAFLSRGFVAWRMRGSVGTLAVLGGFIALTAVINRAGRPLPPDVSAWRLPLIGIALWGAALATRRFGPALGQLLENPRHGRLYHAVPHAGVAALALVLLSSAVRVGVPDLSRALGVVPPLLLLGAALLSLLLAASFRSVGLASLGLGLGLPGAALWAARQSLLGPALAALLPPEGQWVHAAAVTESLDWLQPEAWLASGDTLFLLWQRAFAGIAASGLVYAGAVLAARHDALRDTLRRWSLVTVALVGIAAFLQPGLTAAGLVFATGAVLFLGGAKPQGRGVLGVGLLLVVHAAAHREPLFAPWPGPFLALVALAVVALSPPVARWRGLDAGATRGRALLGASIYLSTALTYALAVGGETSPSMAVPNLWWEALLGFSGQWVVANSLTMTLVFTCATLLVAAFQWKGSLAGWLAGVGAVLAGSVPLTGVSSYVVSMLRLVADMGGATRSEQARLFADDQTVYGRLSTQYGAVLGVAVAVGVLALHLGQRSARGRGRSDVAAGLAFGRDVWLVTTGVLLTAVAVSGRATEAVLSYAITALGLSVLVSLHAAWREQTGRHVYFVQVAVVGTYAMVRSLYAPGLRAEHDALFALMLGFALVGVTVLARRAGVPPVAAATRRFAALLPLGMAMVLPGEATREAALLAGGSGMLYAALGAVERSRLFGTFAAAAGNLALLIAALAFGLEGLEIYLAPLGLLLLMLGQLFTASLPHAARNAVRILGGLLLYVPAAAKLAVGVGTSTDGLYALVFGGVCLLGVAAGMALQIRAYLALGTLFLTLDVVANLLDAGLRDHRVGFLVMTLTGLTIVGGRVLATVKRQEWELVMARVRTQLRGWD